jgi:hypothetical protein
LNPEYYVYIATEGVGPKADSFLRNIGARVMTLENFSSVLKKGTFFSEFKRLQYEPFGVGLQSLGEAEANMYSLLEGFIREDGRNDALTAENVKSAIEQFCTPKRRHILN